MTDEAQFLEEVRVMLTDIAASHKKVLDRRRDAEEVIAECLAEERRLIDLRLAVISTAEMICMRAAVIAAPADQPERKYRDIREEMPPPPRTVPSADHVLDFITRAGAVGVSEDQLKIIGATQSMLNILSHNKTAALGEDGRWRALPSGDKA